LYLIHCFFEGETEMYKKYVALLVIVTLTLFTTIPGIGYAEDDDRGVGDVAMDVVKAVTLTCAGAVSAAGAVTASGISTTVIAAPVSVPVAVSLAGGAVIAGVEAASSVSNLINDIKGLFD
jgi:hypothetical protein